MNTSNDQSSSIPAAVTELLSVLHVSWHADNQLILDDISFAINKGSFTGILGPNGAGKSSLL
ncbi:MAG: ABC-type cobalamin/Fe3+-siderophores transport system ATPase subunit, partial [Colwellia sp.]